MCCIIALHRHFARLTYTCWPNVKYICDTQSFAMDESILNYSSARLLSKPNLILSR